MSASCPHANRCNQPSTAENHAANVDGVTRVDMLTYLTIHSSQVDMFSQHVHPRAAALFRLPAAR